MGQTTFTRYAVPFFVALSALGCGNGKKASQKLYQSECALASDQSGSLYGRWRKVAVPIVFKAGQWSEAEKTAIMDAADTWNSFYGAVAGIQVLDYGSRAAPNELNFNRPAGDVCSYTIYDENAGRYTSGVMLFKQTVWPYGSTSSAIALTTYCKKTSGGAALPSMFMGIIEANYQNFFVPGKKQPDLKSIFVHELGHLLGLDHSCSPSTTAPNGLAACSQVAAAKPEYQDAVMFPTVFFYTDGTSLVKDELQANDQARGNCLYGPTAL